MPRSRRCVRTRIHDDRRTCAKRLYLNHRIRITDAALCLKIRSRRSSGRSFHPICVCFFSVFVVGIAHFFQKGWKSGSSSVRVTFGLDILCVIARASTTVSMTRAGMTSDFFLLPQAVGAVAGTATSGMRRRRLNSATSSAVVMWLSYDPAEKEEVWNGHARTRAVRRCRTEIFFTSDFCQ